jgi:RimJ/RimL family protein N-acetyltransferase
MVMNTVCAEGRWMRTHRFEPTPAWEHALTTPDCPRHLLLIACDGQHIVGWCRVFLTCIAGEADVGIGLLLSYRDRGLGTFSLQQVVDWARRRNLARLMLTTRVDNHCAIHVFEKCGFSSVRQSDEVRIEMQHALQNVETRRQADDS